MVDYSTVSIGKEYHGRLKEMATKEQTSQRSLCEALIDHYHSEFYAEPELEKEHHQLAGVEKRPNERIAGGRQVMANDPDNDTDSGNDVVFDL